MSVLCACTQGTAAPCAVIGNPQQRGNHIVTRVVIRIIHVKLIHETSRRQPEEVRRGYTRKPEARPKPWDDRDSQVIERLCARAAYIIILALILWYATRNLSISQADSLCDHSSQTNLDKLAQRKLKTICYAYLSHSQYQT